VNTLNNIINSVWLVAALLLASLTLATGLPQASFVAWLLAVIAGCVTYLGIRLDDTELLFTPRDLLSTFLIPVGCFVGMSMVFLAPYYGIQIMAYIAGLLAVRQASFKGMLPWIQ